MSRMSLKNTTKGRLADAPMRVLMYGVPGVGKTTFASHAPAPIFLGEDGSGQLDVERFPTPESWQDVKDALVALVMDQHDRKTLVVDTLDWMEPLCWAHLCKAQGKNSIEDFGYGKGYEYALDEWRSMLYRFEQLRRDKGMNIVMLAHSKVRTFKNPDNDAGGDYDRYELKLHHKAAALMIEWAETVLFANHETSTKKVGDRVRGTSTGVRLMHTERRPAWDAKNRFGLPERMDLSWEDFYAAARATRSTEEAVSEVEGLLPQVDNESRLRAMELLQKHRDNPMKLAQLANKLRTKVQPQQNTETAQ